MAIKITQVKSKNGANPKARESLRTPRARQDRLDRRARGLARSCAAQLYKVQHLVRIEE